MTNMAVDDVRCVYLDSSVAAASKTVPHMEHARDMVDVNWAMASVNAWMDGVALPVPSQAWRVVSRMPIVDAAIGAIASTEHADAQPDGPQATVRRGARSVFSAPTRP